ncbi:MAG: substrate-binding domain-containing protein [Spirochaetales bacterium]|nr:substrate-binding domain-containing protein [Spirochaetales bacterium]
MDTKRITVGFFVTKLDYEYQREIWRGICDEAVKEDINLICFPGEIIQSRYKFEYQANILYKIAGKENIDGIVVLTSSIGQFISNKELIRFFHSYKPLPAVSIGIKFKNIPSIIVENTKGLYEVICHLINDHNCRRIAFIAGPKGHQEADQRLKTFNKVMKEYESILEKPVYIQGDFLQSSGNVAVQELLDEIKQPIDAVVAANDSMAIGALEAFQARGINIPDDVIVTGFDNIEESKNYTPPLTTVNQPVYEMGRKALQLLKKIMYNEETPLNIILPSSIVIRQSCGCFSYITKQAFINNTVSRNIPFFPGFLDKKEVMINECATALKKGASPFITQQDCENEILSLISSFYRDMENGKSDNFINLLNKILKNSIVKGTEVTYWHDVISLIRRYTLEFYLKKDQLINAENIYEQARILIGETSRRYQAFKRIQVVKWTNRLREVGNSLISNFDIDELVEAILSAIIRFQISQCYISLYVKDRFFPENAQLFLASKNGKQINLDGKERSYKSKEILPEGIFLKDKRYTMILEPLYFQDDQIGFLFCEMEPDEPNIFETLRQQISSALKGALLLEEIKRYTDNLEKEVARRTLDLTKTNKQLKEEIQLRKKVEESLKEGERNLRAITEATPIPLVIVRMTDGNILYANIPFCITFGIDGGKEWNNKLHDFFYDKKYIQELLEKMQTEDHLSNIELPAFKMDGHSFWVISSFQKMIFKGEECILSGFYDLTERRKLEREVLDAIGNERRRIGQDLHDDICQDMAGMGAIASVIENQLMKINPQKAGKATYLRKLIKNTIVKTKALAKGLYPSGLEYDGLINMIKELSNSIQLQFNVPCKITLDHKVCIDDNPLALHLYRITQEAVINAVRHGKPKNIEIVFNSTYEKVELIIQDDGIGIPKNFKDIEGMGIRSMKYRANMVGGKLDIRRNGKKGTIVTCIITTKNYRI